MICVQSSVGRLCGKVLKIKLEDCIPGTVGEHQVEFPHIYMLQRLTENMMAKTYCALCLCVFEEGISVHWAGESSTPTRHIPVADMGHPVWLISANEALPNKLPWIN